MNVKKTPRIYVETSVWSFEFAEDSPEKRAINRQFFAEAKQGAFELYASDTVVKELRRAQEPLRSQLLSFIDSIGPTYLDVSDAALDLAEEYVRAGAIPSRYATDGLHMAIATVEDMDVVVSWNMKHIVRSVTRRIVHGINLLAGYHAIEISTPEMELVGDDEEATDAT